MTSIVQNGDPILRKVAHDISPADIKSARVQKIIRDMRMALEKEEDGVALAAPQIGISLRIFVLSPRVFEGNEEENHGTEDPSPPQKKRVQSTDHQLVYINPVIIKLSRKKRDLDEGCLSVRWLYGKVARAERAMVAAIGADGKPFTRGASALLAQIFQHEIDHLDGLLFIDKAKDIQEIPPEKQKTAASKRPHV